MSEFALATSWYALDSGESDGGPPFKIHGVALPPDTTAYSGGEDIHFSAGELREAAGSLKGESITEGHPSDYPYPVSDTIGRITKSSWDEQLGVVYEGVVSDSEIAQKIDSGALDVSAHVMSNDGGETDDGAINAVDLKLIGLAVVSQGAAEGNSVESGPLSIDTPTPTAQADGDVQSQVALALESPTDEPGSTDPRTFTPGVAEEFTPPDGLESLRSPSGGDGSPTPDESESDDTGGRVDSGGDGSDDMDARLDALEDDVQERLAAKNERIKELEEQLTEARQYIDTLESAGESVMQVDDEMRAMLSTELAANAPMGADELAERFDVVELWDMHQESDNVGSLGGARTSHTATPAEPDVQSGATPGRRGTALSSAEQARASELRDEIENIRGLADTALHQSMIDNRKEELEELTGEYTGP